MYLAERNRGMGGGETGRDSHKGSEGLDSAGKCAAKGSETLSPRLNLQRHLGGNFQDYYVA